MVWSKDLNLDTKSTIYKAVIVGILLYGDNKVVPGQNIEKFCVLWILHTLRVTDGFLVALHEDLAY